MLCKMGTYAVHEGSELAFREVVQTMGQIIPYRSFTACKRSLNVRCESAFRQKFRIILAHSSTFRRWVLSRGDTRAEAWWRNLERLTQIAHRWTPSEFIPLESCSA